MFTTKVGIYVDVENIIRNGGFGIQYDVLRKFVCDDGSVPIRLNAYVGYDRKKAQQDDNYNDWTRNYFSRIRSFGYKLIAKEVKWFRDEAGDLYAKANADLDMAIDALLQSENLDRVVLVTGDGDFTRVARALQNKGCRVEVIAFDNVSPDLRGETDVFTSGYLVPNLLSIRDSKPWGDIGSRVRGMCYYFNRDEKFGYFRFLQQFGPLWITDSREKDSPYQTVYFHADSVLNNEVVKELPSRELVFEFTLVESDRGNRLRAEQIALVSELYFRRPGGKGNGGIQPER